MPGTDYQTLSNPYLFHANLMPRIDYQTLNNPYLFHAWNRLSDTKQSIFISGMEQTITHYATPTNLLPRIDYQTLNSTFLFHA